MASVDGNHNHRCAKAKKRACACTGCGGSKHGVDSWVGLANGTSEARRARRETVDAQWQDNYWPRRKRQNQNKDCRSAGTDSARLDLADWLADSRRTTPSANDPKDPPAPNPRIPSPSTPEGQHDPAVGDLEPSEPPECQPPTEGVGCQGETIRLTAPPGSQQPSDPEIRPTPVQQVETFAQAITSAWSEISASIDGDTHGRGRASVTQHGRA